jgi:acetyl esterase/lipase
MAPETRLPAIIQDVQDAYRWVREKGPDLSHIDPSRIAVKGGSAGGYLTLMTGFCVEPRPKALVPLYGYGDIAGPWYSRPDPFLVSSFVSKFNTGKGRLTTSTKQQYSCVSDSRLRFLR